MEKKHSYIFLIYDLHESRIDLRPKQIKQMLDISTKINANKLL